MHEFALSQSGKDLIVKVRGRLHAFETLDPARTALLVVDMQNAFVMKDVAHAWVPEAASIVPNINALASSLRAAGGSVVWIKNTFTEESLESWSHFHDQLWAPGRKEKRIAAMSEGTLGHQICEGLEVEPEFFQGFSTIDFGSLFGIFPHLYGESYFFSITDKDDFYLFPHQRCRRQA